MTTLRLTLEATAGTSVNQAAVEMTRVANLLGLVVDCRFNDVDLTANPGGDPDLLADAYSRVVQTKGRVKMAFSNGRIASFDGQAA